MNSNKGVLTPEMIEEATKRAIEMPGRPIDRIISYRAHKLLKKINQKLPNWDSWTFESEILWKARSMGIMEEE